MDVVHESSLLRYNPRSWALGKHLLWGEPVVQHFLLLNHSKDSHCKNSLGSDAPRV